MLANSEVQSTSRCSIAFNSAQFCFFSQFTTHDTNVSASERNKYTKAIYVWFMCCWGVDVENCFCLFLRTLFLSLLIFVGLFDILSIRCISQAQTQHIFFYQTDCGHKKIDFHNQKHE